jgi:hypothetical protein
MIPIAHGPSRAVGCLIFASLFVAARGGAEVVPSIGVSEIYTSNPRLEREPTTSERITVIEPGLLFERAGPRSDVSLLYSLQGVYYDEFDESDETFHQLTAANTFTLAESKAYFDLDVDYYQTLNDPEELFSFGNVSITDNRLNAAELRASPYVLLGSEAGVGGELRFAHLRVDYDDETVLDSDASGMDFVLGSPRTRNGAGWNVDYGYRELVFEGFDEYEFQHVHVEFWHRINQRLRLFLVEGLESDFLEPTDGSLVENYWEAGIEWSASERSRFLIASGDRSFGGSERVEWTYQLQGGSFSLSYSEAANVDLPYTDPRRVINDDIGTIDDILGAPGDTTVYVQNRAEMSLNFQTARSVFGLEFFEDERSDPVPGTGPTTSTQQARGATLEWTWRLTRLLSFSPSAIWIDRSFGTGESDDELSRYRLALDRALGRTAAITFTVQRQQQRRDDPTANNNYVEEQLRVEFSKSF